MNDIASLLPGILEAGMVISFGISWPTSIVKSFKSRTAKGKSLIFMIFILFGYLCGIASKLALAHASGKPLTYVFIFYVLNFVMVAFDMVLYFRNRRLDKTK